MSLASYIIWPSSLSRAVQRRRHTVEHWAAHNWTHWIMEVLVNASFFQKAPAYIIVHLVPDIWSTLGQAKSWPYSQNCPEFDLISENFTKDEEIGTAKKLTKYTKRPYIPIIRRPSNQNQVYNYNNYPYLGGLKRWLSWLSVFTNAK